VKPEFGLIFGLIEKFHDAEREFPRNQKLCDEFKSQLSKHPFFDDDRWTFLFYGANSLVCEEDDDIVPSFKYDTVTGDLLTVGDLTNYDGTISKYIDWLSQYVVAEDGQKIGYRWYEEANEPELIIWDSQSNSAKIIRNDSTADTSYTCWEY
jgi:hypothetical protein